MRMKYFQERPDKETEEARTWVTLWSWQPPELPLLDFFLGEKPKSPIWVNAYVGSIYMQPNTASY